MFDVEEGKKVVGSEKVCRVSWISAWLSSRGKEGGVKLEVRVVLMKDHLEVARSR
jgi:hypothetical protein